MPAPVLLTLLGNHTPAASGAVWTPDGGPSAGSPVALSDFQTLPDQASVTIVCTATASWTWSATGTGGTFTSSVPSDWSSTQITFTLTGTLGAIRQRKITLSSTSGGVTKYWTITLNVDGT